MADVEQIGPYDREKCHYCGKSAKDGVEFTAGYIRKEGSKEFDACQYCVNPGGKDGQ